MLTILLIFFNFFNFVNLPSGNRGRLQFAVSIGCRTVKVFHSKYMD
jgi:hypothetical protein